MSDPTRPTIITISRQMGSGGSEIGQILAMRLGWRYADRDAIVELARRASEAAGRVPLPLEQIPLTWDPFSPFGMGVAEAFLPPGLLSPTPMELFQDEADAITRIAGDHPAVIVGRCGVHVLKDHPASFHVHLHAARHVREERLHTLYGITTEEAARRIEHSDRQRSERFHDIVGRHWTDARLYHLCIDTGRLGIEASAELILRAGGLD